MVKVYIVIELRDTPKIIGVYRSRKAAEAVAYENASVWRNVVEKELEG